jgi:hypothetical protein
VNACVHTYTKPRTSSTRSRGLGRRIHGSVEDTKLSTNKQHSLSAAAKLEPRLRTEAFKDMWALKETCREVQRRHLELLCYALVIVPNWKCKAGCNT